MLVNYVILDVDYRLCITLLIHQLWGYKAEITSGSTQTKKVEYHCFK
jgi:hypothetical protein